MHVLPLKYVSFLVPFKLDSNQIGFNLDIDNI